MKSRYLLLLCLIALLCSAAPTFAAQLLYSFDLDSSPGWTMQGGWKFGAPPGTYCVPGAHTGSNIYGYQVGTSYCSGDMASPESLTTSAVNCTGAEDVHLRFWRDLGKADEDRAAVEVSTNGSTWTTVWETTDWVGDGGWTLCDYNISALADGQATVYLRWVLGPMVSDSCYCIGFNIDDVQLWEGAPPPALTSHPVYTWNLDSNPGWATEGAWAYGTPTGVSGDPTSGHTGTSVYGYNLAGAYTNSMPAYSLTTNSIYCGNIEGATLVFWRWLGVENWTWDHAYVQVSNDGIAWTTLWQNQGTTISYENYWQLCVYDISAIADGQTFVYIRWVMGPTDSTVTYCGWNIDDIQIWEGPPVGILAWNAYADVVADHEYDHTLSALTSELGDGFLVQPFTVNGQTVGDATKLSRQLEGKQVFLVPEPESATSGQLPIAGAEFGPTLQSFVDNGGTVVEACEYSLASGFLTAAGLMDLTHYGSGDSLILPVAAPWHPVAFGLGSSVTGQNYTSLYTVGSDALPIVTDGAGHSAVAVRDYGAGAVVALGYDFFLYDSDAAQLLANAVLYPRYNSRRILLYSDSPNTHRGAEALRRLGYGFTQTNELTFDEALTTAPWDLVVFDNPYFSPYAAGSYGYDDSLLDYLDVRGKSVADTWRLNDVDLASAFNVSPTATLSTPAPVYAWTADPFFSTPNYVPNLTTWEDLWFTDGFELTAVYPGAAHAGYAATETTGRAAVVADIWNTKIMNGFLWEEAGQDADGDGVQDVVELAMNQIVQLTKNPYVEAGFSPTQTTTGATVNFTGNLSATAVGGATWWFGDGIGLGSAVTSHAYTNPGFYTVSFVGDRGDSHYGIRTASRQLAVGFTDAGPTYWAFPYIIACYEAGIVSGYWDGYHPTETVTRAQMAVYMARAVAGGDAYVPAGPGTAFFADVPTTHWAFKYVEYCYAQGIVTGYWDGYHPDEAVNRAQMAVYVARALAGGDAGVPAGPVTATFTDVATTHWAYKYVEYCVASGVVSGYWDNTYRPTVTVDRGAMSVYVQRAFDLWMPYS